MTTIRTEPLTAAAFAPFGEVLAPRATPDRLINAGRCERHHALATVERGGGEAILSIFRSAPVSLPYDCTLLERHPLGSQAFMPLGPDPWLSVVAPDVAGFQAVMDALLDSGAGLRRYFSYIVTKPVKDQPVAGAMLEHHRPEG